jgi:hypothetical protein
MSVHRGWIRLPSYSSRLSDVDVADAQDGSWGCLCFALVYLDAKPSHVGLDMDGLACPLHRPTDND